MRALRAMAASLCFVGHAAGAQAAAIDDGELYLEVTLNERATGQILPFVQRDGVLLAPASTLQRLGIAAQPGAEGATQVRLGDLPGLQVRFDPRLQKIAIQAPLSLLNLPTTRLEAHPLTPPVPSAPEPGLLLNYDLYAAQGRDGTQWSAATESRVFGVGPGVYSHTMLTRFLRPADSQDDRWRSRSVRLDSSWQMSWPERVMDLQLGDSVSGSLDWSRALRLGGVRIGSDFRLQPYRATTPQPSFYGEVAVPSTVELYVNGLKQYSSRVPPGPFEIDSRPGINGAGQAQVVISDAFGRSRTLTLPFYGSQQLLAAGLTDWSASLGRARLDYGLRSFSYDSAVLATASLRHGVSDRLTLEGHAEGGASVRNAGIGGLWLMGQDGQSGVLRASLAGGSLQSERGLQWAAGYQWTRDGLFLDLNTQRTVGDYRDIASRYGQLPPSVSERASAGVSVRSLGNVALSYVRLAYPGGDDGRYAGLSWSRQFGPRLALNASLNRRLDGARELSAFVGLSWTLDGGQTVSSAAQHVGGRLSSSVDAGSPVPGDGGWGWRTQLREDGGRLGAQAEAGWLGRYGRASAGIARLGDNSYGYGSASGALVVMRDGVFATRDVSDGFAVVSTDGTPGVPVKLENRLVGLTDEDGVLLVTGLNAWQYNRVGIDPMPLPADLRFGAIEQNATPSNRAGTAVRFRLTPVRAALLVVHDERGQPLPIGSRAREAGRAPGDADAVVGYDGELYLDALTVDNHVQIDVPGSRRCELHFVLPPGATGIARLGPLRCATEAAP